MRRRLAAGRSDIPDPHHHVAVLNPKLTARKNVSYDLGNRRRLAGTIAGVIRQFRVPSLEQEHIADLIASVVEAHFECLVAIVNGVEVDRPRLQCVASICMWCSHGGFGHRIFLAAAPHVHGPVGSAILDQLFARQAGA